MPIEILTAYAHLCVDREDPKNHKLSNICLIFDKDKELPETLECPKCKIVQKKGLVRTGYYSEGTA